MKRKNIWTLLLLFGLISTSTGCGEETIEWAVHGQWVYVNESTHTLEISGVWPNPYTDDITFLLQPGDSHILKTTGNSAERCSSDEVPNPFISNWSDAKVTLRISVDDNTPTEIEFSTGIWDRENYRVEKLKRRTFRFTYVFTDRNIPSGKPETSGQVQ